MRSNACLNTALLHGVGAILSFNLKGTESGDYHRISQKRERLVELGSSLTFLQVAIERVLSELDLGWAEEDGILSGSLDTAGTDLKQKNALLTFHC